MDTFVAERGWYGAGSPKPQTARNLASSIAIEAAEVVECFQWAEDADPDEVAAELADVVLYAAQLANVIDVDLGAAVAAKMALNETRWAVVGGNAQWPKLQAS
ncbi:MAG TPA: nucleotide pyrophosphohydrolase [Thermoleophilaceae bacterium]|nr:nucleotide pyrophosphohydrolase [Thermoleophilaceae bacterium]